METIEIKAVEMTRQIRDQIYAQTKSLSSAEIIAYYRNGSRKFQSRAKQKRVVNRSKTGSHRIQATRSTRRSTRVVA